MLLKCVVKKNFWMDSFVCNANTVLLWFQFPNAFWGHCMWKATLRVLLNRNGSNGGSELYSAVKRVWQTCRHPSVPTFTPDCTHNIQLLLHPLPPMLQCLQNVVLCSKLMGFDITNPDLTNHKHPSDATVVHFHKLHNNRKHSYLCIQGNRYSGEISWSFQRIGLSCWGREWWKCQWRICCYRWNRTA